MGKLPKLIDNKRRVLSDVINDLAPKYKKVSIATGYWDLEGTLLIINSLTNYESIRLLIGQEPFRHYESKKIDDRFPEYYIKNDLENMVVLDTNKALRETARALIELVKDKALEIKVIKKPILHAKAYIFGDFDSDDAVGIVGSSNFTKAGLTSNLELNSVERESMVVRFSPRNIDDEFGHLSWFDNLWNSEYAEDWTGEFQNILNNSPVGELSYGAYDVYIKTLMELFPEELKPPIAFEGKIKDVLFAFQNRNAGILINKMEKTGLAMLADSVGLGKTITAGAVIKYYIEKKNQTRIFVICPASLRKQWVHDLGRNFDLVIDRDFKILSMQNHESIQSTIDYGREKWMKNNPINLFVIDEAHNLRGRGGDRYNLIMKLLQENPGAKTLLLTATPINNSLMDIANQIQLASKGKLKSVNVPYKRPESGGTGKLEMIDFFDALKRIQSYIHRSEKQGIPFDFDAVKQTIHAGLRHYLVRSTRQGVEAEGGMAKDGAQRKFPKSKVSNIEYQFDETATRYVNRELVSKIDVFEGFDCTTLDLELYSDLTQQSKHPLDYIKEFIKASDSDITRYGMEAKPFDRPDFGVVKNLLQAVYLLGLAPYRPDIYRHDYYGKEMEDIRVLKPDLSINIQLIVHNIIHVSLLKRLESSLYAFSKSINNYEARLDLFDKYLKKGLILNLSDIQLLEDTYDLGEDIELAFDDYDNYVKDIEKADLNGEDVNKIKRKGVDRRFIDSSTYNVEQLKEDINRDRRILELIKSILLKLMNENHDPKIGAVAQKIKSVISGNTYGKKVLVFSFFADTIEYLKDNFSKYVSEIDNFENKSAYISGLSTLDVEEIARRFSPKSKGHQTLLDTEIDFLFATDVLSEGQNLQDAGFLINYDLHWNPVRMIQRNGRVNRLGSEFEEVLIENCKPTKELDLYLKLVNRLENKIKTIRNTIGLDQGILNQSDVNPIDFIERYYTNGDLPVPDDDLLAYTDEHIINLRKFIATNSQDSERFKYVSEIPLGKWNLLPDKTQYGDVLGLIRVKGFTKKAKKSIDDLLFVKVQPYGEFQTEYFDTNSALELIKTTIDDNKRNIERISHDRVQTQNRATALAKTKTLSANSDFKITPQIERGLNVIKNYLPKELDLIRLVRFGITDYLIERDFRSLVKEIVQLDKDGKSIGIDVLNKFRDLLIVLEENASINNEEKEISESKGVLYYVK